MAEHSAEEIAADLAFRIATAAESERHNQGMLGYVIAVTEPLIAAAINAARAETGEEAAKIAESYWLPTQNKPPLGVDWYKEGWATASKYIGAAIRAHFAKDKP